MSAESSRQSRAVTEVTGTKYCRDGQHEVKADQGEYYQPVGRGPKRWICNACQKRRLDAMKGKK